MPLFACLEGALHLETAAVESQALCARAGGHISSVSRGSSVSGMVGLHLFRSETIFFSFPSSRAVATDVKVTVRFAQ